MAYQLTLKKDGILNPLLTSAIIPATTQDIVVQDRERDARRRAYPDETLVFMSDYVPQYESEVGGLGLLRSGGTTMMFVSAAELAAHATHDAAMYQQMTNSVRTSIQNSLTSYYTKAQAQSVTQSTIATALVPYSTSAQVDSKIAAAIQSSSLTTDQINDIVNRAIEVAGTDVVTVSQMTTALNAMSAAVPASLVLETSDSGIDPNGQYFLQGTKYADGRLEITGWIAKCSDLFSAYFPGSFEFIDTNYAANAVGADTESLDEATRSVRSATFGTLRTDSFSVKCSKFGVAILGGAAVGDDGTYSVSFFGRWK